MNSSETLPNQALDHSHSVESEPLENGCNQPNLISDDDIDYDEIHESTQTDFEAGRFVFNTRDYATDEEAMTAMDALLMKWWTEAPNDDGT